MLMCTLELDVRMIGSGGKRRDWGKADFGRVRNDLNLDWEGIQEGKNVNETWLEIKNRIKGAMDSHATWKRSGGRERPKWMSRRISNLINKKKKLGKVQKIWNGDR